MNSLIPICYRLNSITAILLQGWLLHLITHEGWYAIKQRNQTKNLSIYGELKVLQYSVVVVEGDSKASFSIATTPGEGAIPFPGLLQFTLDIIL